MTEVAEAASAEPAVEKKPASPAQIAAAANARAARKGKDALKAQMLALPAAPAVPLAAPPIHEDFEPFAPPVPAEVPPAVPGFLSWTEFCNRVTVEIVLAPTLYSKIGKYSVLGSLEAAREFLVREPGPFYGIMRGAYLAMHSVHSVGAQEFGRE